MRKAFLAVVFLITGALAVFATFPQVEQHVASRNDSPYKWLYQNLLTAAYPGSGSETTYNTLTVSGEDANDSTMYYWMFPSTAIAFTVAGDSIAFKVYAETCHIEPGATAAVPVTVVDSLTVTTTGRKIWTVLTTAMDENIRFRFVGQAGNGKDGTVLTDMRLNRSWEAGGPSWNLRNVILLNTVDSTVTVTGGLSVTNIANGSNGFVEKEALADSVGWAWTWAAADSVKINDLRKAAEADTAHYNTAYTHSQTTHGTMSAQNADAVNITGGSVKITTLFKLPLNATIPDTSGYVGGEMFTFGGDSLYVYKADHTIISIP